ncbi:hypothetical protein ACJ4V0_09390 [Phreatobacter sp. HK31-P]
MQTLRRLIPVLLMLAAGALPAHGEDPMPGRPQVAAMAFTLTQGETDACGPGCSRWIAAEGAILAATPLAFLEAVQALGSGKPPVLIHSDGGVVEAAMALGRLMRRAGLATVVARTDRSGLVPAPGLDGACHGACLYLLLAGTERAVAPGAVVSIQPLAFPGPAAEPFPDAMRARLTSAALVRVRAYLGEMGIEPTLADFLDGERYAPFYPDRGFLEMHGIVTRDQPW